MSPETKKTLTRVLTVSAAVGLLLLIFRVVPFGEVMHFVDKRADAKPENIAREVVAYLASNGVQGAQAERAVPTIEDTFIARMGAPEGEGEAETKQRGAA